MSDDSRDVEPDDALTGKPTRTAEQLRQNPDLLEQLLEAPDGTPGKDVAQRVKRELTGAAPLVEEGVKHAKHWDRLHGKASDVTRSLAEVLTRLRALYEDSDGYPDMAGRSDAYRKAAAAIYVKAGLDKKKAKSCQVAVRYHLSDTVREYIRGELAGGDEDQYRVWCARYGLNPLSINDRRKTGDDTISLPAVRVRTDNAAAAYFGAVHYARRALELPSGIAAPATHLSPEERDDLRDELMDVQTRIVELLAKLSATE